MTDKNFATIILVILALIIFWGFSRKADPVYPGSSFQCTPDYMGGCN
jgi:hypothetical protein